MNPSKDPEANEVAMLQQLDYLDGARVLEVGCGDGRLTRRYAHRPLLVTAVDPDRESIAAAAAHRPVPPNLNFLVADAEALPVAAGSADVVILAWSL